MSELDVLLRESLGRLAEPGDPTGVADAVRARVGAAGAGGETPPGAGPTGGGGSGAAGAGGGGASTGFWGGWAPLAVLGAVGLVGGIGLALAQGPDPLAADATVPLEISLPMTVPGAACPGGAPVAQLDGGAHVLALYRSEDGAFLAVRNPALLGQTVWIPASSAIVDEGQDVEALPVDGCHEGGIIVAAPEPEPVPTETAPLPEETTDPKPGPKPQPEPAPDTSAPTISGGQWTPSGVYSAYYTECEPSSTSISLSVTDNVGVNNVSGTTNFAGLTVVAQGHSGALWTFSVTPPYGGQPSAGPDVVVTATFTATDAAGNASQVTRQFTYKYCFG
jgi:hypothetical protein